MSGAEDIGRSALSVAYALALAVSSACIAYVLWVFGISIIRDGAPPFRALGRAALILLIPLGPGTFTLLGAAILARVREEPSTLYRLATVACAAWTAIATWTLANL